MTFEELGLKSGVLKSLKTLGFETPTPIQQEAIPHLLKEESDFVGLAQTGTGKTAAFGLPLVSKVEEGRKKPQGLVICPTRELCLQISKDIQNYSKNVNVNTVAVYGGTDIKRQIQDIKKGAQIIVATPGRLVDLTNRRAIDLNQIDWVVLDEADEMLNMGFKEDIDHILDHTPLERNVWLFSATMPKEVASIAKNYMEQPLEVSIGHKNQTNENIEHIYFTVSDRDRYSAVKRLIDFNPNIYGLIFCRTRRETAAVAEKLGKEGYSAEPLHGDLSQAQRDNVMRRFRTKAIQILVATDVAARGIDVDDITHVINYNLPDEIENYTHRSGRTARAGKHGESLVLVTPRESYKIKQIEKKIRTSFTKGNIPNAKEICEIQLMKLVDKVITTPVKEEDMAEFLPAVMQEFDSFSKEEVIKKFVSAEFNRFIEYYNRAGDINAKEGRGRDRDRDRGERGDRRERGGRRNDENKTRFFVNLGKRDGLNPGGLLRVVCDSTGLKSDKVGRIDILASFSFFEADNNLADDIIQKVNGADYEGNTVSVEVTKKKSDGGSRGGNRGGGKRRSGGGGGHRGKRDRGFSGGENRSRERSRRR
ncbi:MAG: DEAD/DEAH box helicase [Crocinitomicaceae bacterium]|jgi:ATP-dependent RNA helicase DeaD|nr:DEAD/DEAH box helicase [Crocinitomicaceae bacterium]